MKQPMKRKETLEAFFKEHAPDVIESEANFEKLKDENEALGKRIKQREQNIKKLEKLEKAYPQQSQFLFRVTFFTGLVVGAASLMIGQPWPFCLAYAAGSAALVAGYPALKLYQLKSKLQKMDAKISISEPNHPPARTGVSLPKTDKTLCTAYDAPSSSTPASTSSSSSSSPVLRKRRF
jgi:hypothetical protein